MSKRMTRYPTNRKVYVGDLGDSARKEDLKAIFGSYGKLRSVWVAQNPPGFAFVEFEDERDAYDAKRGLDGRIICGKKARVKLSTESGRRGLDDGGRSRARLGKCYECGESGHIAKECRRGRDRRRSVTRSRSRSAHRRPRSISPSYVQRESRKPIGRSQREKERHQNGSNHEDYERNSSTGSRRRFYSKSPEIRKGRSIYQNGADEGEKFSNAKLGIRQDFSKQRYSDPPSPKRISERRSGPSKYRREEDTPSKYHRHEGTSSKYRRHEDTAESRSRNYGRHN